MSADLSAAQMLYRSGKPAEAVTRLKEILAKNPRDGNANSQLALWLTESGQLEDAEYYAKAALVSDMRNAAYHVLLGKVCLLQGNREEAIKAFDRALIVDPVCLDAFQVRVKFALEDKDYEAAERALAPMLTRYPDMPEMLALLLQVRKEQKRYHAVAELGDRILALRPDYNDAQFLVRYALGLEEVGRLQESIERHEQVYQQLEAHPYDPQNEQAKAEILYNIGLAHENLGHFDQAQRHYERALVLDDDHLKCRFALETLLIKVSDLKRDLSSFSMRFLLKERQQRHYPFPEWKGESLKGKRLLIWAEQGIGDVAMYAGFIPHVLSQVSYLMIDMFSYLVPVFQRSFPGARVVAFPDDFTPSQEALAESFDYHAPMGSLMMYLLKDYKPNAVKGYLKPNPERMEYFKKRNEALGPGLKVGISWRTIHPTSRFRRDIPLEEWGAIFAVPGCHFISLQYSNEEKEIEMARERFGVDILLDKSINPFESRDDFLTQAASMDTIVSIQNSAVHMGGATNTDTIIMLARAADFRWGITPENSVWYPSVHIVRQQKYGDWKPVIGRVAQMLKEKTKHG